MFKRYKTGQYPIVNGVCEFLCSSLDDIPKLPRYDIPGTQDGDAFDNTPCGYRSVAMVCDGVNPTELYILNPENNWVKI